MSVSRSETLEVEAPATRGLSRDGLPVPLRTGSVGAVGVGGGTKCDPDQEAHRGGGPVTGRWTGRGVAPLSRDRGMPLTTRDRNSQPGTPRQGGKSGLRQKEGSHSTHSRPSRRRVAPSSSFRTGRTRPPTRREDRSVPGRLASDLVVYGSP